VSSNAFDAAVRLLKGRSKSRARLEQALLQRGHPKAEVEQALARLVELKYLSDERHSEAKARSALASGRSLADVQRRLEAEGVEPAIAAQAARRAADEAGYDEVAAAKRLLGKRRLTGAKAARFLASRGFSEELIERLVGLAVDD
jgi:SOS response regulatory protein OraA/RecX